MLDHEKLQTALKSFLDESAEDFLIPVDEVPVKIKNSIFKIQQEIILAFRGDTIPGEVSDCLEDLMRIYNLFDKIQDQGYEKVRSSTA